MNEALKKYLDSKDYQKVADEAVLWVKNWFEKNGPDAKAVIGISGGKDSSVVAALCVKALGKDRVVGVMMPNSVQPDIDVSKKVVEFLGIENYEINIMDGYNGVLDTVGEAGFELSKQARVNLGPRIRMSVLYAVAQCVNGRVSNNGNASERYVGYFTIFGDGAGDFAPLANLTVHEVRLVGKALGLPEVFTEKPPTDGLTGKTDEDNLGFTYEDLDTYILTGVCENEETKALIKKKHDATMFKLNPMPQFTC